MGIYVTKDQADNNFNVVVSSATDTPMSFVTAVQEQCRPGSVKSVVLPGVDNPVQWQAALKQIAGYLRANATVTTSGSLCDFSMRGTNLAALQQLQMTDMQQAQTIMTQIQADAQKQQAERWKIIQDTQTKIFEITQDVTVNKVKSADKARKAWDAYIRS